ncbi:PspC domain-containing protein [Thermococcus piezophilus]|uniref:Transcriptional regulator n=1 Tax=Thermococcus piezophilus TaxID=1712654 RepID=A0A172WFD5_9EURY|nr:PspC domain-containing protein [Thermococcus piezophilus]ANF22105.1 transcriptional regulator [Thermococcus piezophilus]
MAKRLMRSKDNRVFLGVLGGIAEHLEIDPTLVRVIFVVLLVFNPSAMTLLYFLLALVMPEEENGETSLEEKLNKLADETEKKINDIFSGSNSTKTFAIILIAIGAAIVAKPLFPLIIGPIGGTTLLALTLLVIGIILLKRSD